MREESHRVHFKAACPGAKDQILSWLNPSFPNPLDDKKSRTKNRRGIAFISLHSNWNRIWERAKNIGEELHSFFVLDFLSLFRFLSESLHGRQLA
jgi:hypothetical protein